MVRKELTHINENTFNHLFLAKSNGDSGGPLMKYNEKNDVSYWYIVGIVSFGISDPQGGACGVVGRPGVYTKVSEYLEWINQNID